jgi:ribonuclease T1
MPILRLLLLALLPLLSACSQGAPEPTTPGFVGVSAARSLEPTQNPASAGGMTVADLPPEGRATLALIKQGGPFPFSRDGIVFGNREGLLPAQSRGYYREYTVPTPGLNHRGPRRIVSGGHGAEYWYTADHYRSFKRIRE